MTGIDVAKALQTTTNSGAELAVLLDPIIQRAADDLNFMRNIIRRTPHVGKWYTWRVNNAFNSSVGAMGEYDAVTTGNQTRVQPQATMKIIKVGVEVSDLMIEASKRGGAPGVQDMLGEEIRTATLDVLKEENNQIFKQSSSPTGSGSYITDLATICDDGTNYGTIYDQTRSSSSSDNWMDATLVNASSNPVSYAYIQQAKRACIANSTTGKGGAFLGDLLMVSDHTQRDLGLQVFQDQQRFIGKKTLKVGFEDIPTVDGIPWYADVNCGSSVIFTLDMSVLDMKVLKEFGIKTLPTQKLAEVRAIAAFEELVCKQPSRNAQIYGLATSL